MNNVRLLFNSVSEIAGNEKIGLITLTDESHERLISIVCDWNTAEAIDIRVKHKMDKSNTLPEVMAAMLKARCKDERKYYVCILGLEEEQYKTFIVGEDSAEMYKIKASEAVLLSLVLDIPIYIEGTLMKKQSIKNRSCTDKVSIPINVINSSILQETLERAIQTEDYETASKIHDELERRKRQENKNSKIQD